MTDRPIKLVSLAAALAALGTAEQAVASTPASSEPKSTLTPDQTQTNSLPNTFFSTGADLFGYTIVRDQQGTIIAQMHHSHASHASHASHHSHYSSR